MSDQQPPSPNQHQRVAERMHDQIAELAIKVNEATINLGNLALRTVLLINGGAAVALLSFMGGLPKDQRQALASALAWFAWGVVAAASGLGLAYVTNYLSVGIFRSMVLWHEPPFIRKGPHTPVWTWLNRAAHIAAFLAGVGSLVLFVVGMLGVKSAFINL